MKGVFRPCVVHVIGNVARFEINIHLYDVSLLQSQKKRECDCQSPTQFNPARVSSISVVYAWYYYNYKAIKQVSSILAFNTALILAKYHALSVNISPPPPSPSLSGQSHPSRVNFYWNGEGCKLPTPDQGFVSGNDLFMCSCEQYLECILLFNSTM